MDNSLLHANHKEVLQPEGEKRHRLPVVAALVVLTAALLASAELGATEAPGAPGVGSAWTSGAKQGLGTSTTSDSKVWYTLGQGILNEVYYPQVDVPNVQDFQFIVSDGSTFVDLERDATNQHQQVQLVDPQALTYRQINTANSGRYTITKTYITDPNHSTLLIQTRFQVLSGGPYQLYVLYNPSLNGSGKCDTAATSGNALVASDNGMCGRSQIVASALVASSGFTQMSSGYSGTSSDGFKDLTQNKHLTAQFDSASAPGNIVQIGQISVGNDTTFTLALGFGSTQTEAVSNANASLGTGFATLESAYKSGWHSYLASLKPAPNSVTSNGLTTQYNVALMALKAHEDKTFPGANVASLSTPWGYAKGADQCCPPDSGGYQAVWARDLYQIATGLLAAGDTGAANRSLDYLLNHQQRSDGSFPHNSRVNGDSIPNLSVIQLDEAAFPIILAWQLGRTDAATWAKLKKTADFIVNNGPSTPQERWEENGGFSPSTIAAEIASLVCAADIAQKNGDSASANTYLAKADDWQGNIENWTFTTTGPLGDHQYYIRIDDNTNPNDGDSLNIRNGGGDFDERAIVDAGFLELVRLGVKPENDPKVAASLPEIDSTIENSLAPDGVMFYRYNHDGYGQRADGGPFLGQGVGRPWPILSGERGEYTLANHGSALSFLMTMAKAANQGYMIPEQVWDQPNAFGFTTGQSPDSAMPLAWSMAQFVRLAVSIDEGKPDERPQVVYDRYKNPVVVITAKFICNNGITTPGQSVYVVGNIPALGNWAPAQGVKLNPDGPYPTWTGIIPVPPNTAIQWKCIKRPENADNPVAWQPDPNNAFTSPLSGSVTVTGDFAGGTVAEQFICDNGITVMGQSVYVSGSIPALGNWDPSKAVKLDPTAYPRWTGTVSNLPPNTAVQWKCIKRPENADNPVIWQHDPNNSFTSPASGQGATNGAF